MTCEDVGAYRIIVDDENTKKKHDEWAYMLREDAIKNMEILLAFKYIFQYK
jgi:hypothetical protein